MKKKQWKGNALCQKPVLDAPFSATRENPEMRQHFGIFVCLECAVADGGSSARLQAR
jgi:hypothetical protein